MPEARNISCAAWAPVIPRKVRTWEYFLNPDFVRQLAHSDRAKAGRMKRKYVGSICMNMVLYPFESVQQAEPGSYFSCPGLIQWHRRRRTAMGAHEKIALVTGGSRGIGRR